MATITAAEAGSPNVVKMLDTIAELCEGTDKYPGTTNHGYDCIVAGINGHQLFTDYSQHPNILVQVNHAHPPLESTAAGRYQELHRNWVAMQPQLDLPDFGPLSQDKMAIEHLKECGALPLLIAGDIQEAVLKANHIWASLPLSPYGQPTVTMPAFLNHFNSLSEPA